MARIIQGDVNKFPFQINEGPCLHIHGTLKDEYLYKRYKDEYLYKRYL